MHTHTDYCDGEGSVEDFCEAAVAKGFSAVGFSAHAPLSLETDWHLPIERLAAYCADVNAARQRWRGRLAVYLGLEADYIDGAAAPTLWDKNKYGLDYVIGSVHYIPTPHGAAREVDGSAESFRELVEVHFGGDALKAVRVYYRCVEKMVEGGGFDILGHFDLIKKNNLHDRWFSLEDPAYKAAVSHAAALIVDAQKTAGFAVEVNTGGIARGRYPDTYPSAAVLRMLSGVPCVITADAHHPDQMGTGYDRAAANLREAGWRECAVYEGPGANGKPQWSFAPL
jgi:histidinol-phosphatase (PHP family)